MKIDLILLITHILNKTTDEILRVVPRDRLGDFHLVEEVLVCDLVLALHCQHFYQLPDMEKLLVALKVNAEWW